MVIRASWTLATIVLTILTQAYAPALANTCAVQTAPTMGWRYEFSNNVILPSYMRRTNSQEMVDMAREDIERRWAMSPSVQNPVVHQIGYDNPEGAIFVTWKVTGTVMGDDGPYPYDSLNEGTSMYLDLREDYTCPSGYTFNLDPSGNPTCYVDNVNFRECPTDVKPDKNRECPPGNMEGNPCNVATGNKFQVEVDYEGHADSHLTYSRYYNSDTTVPLGSHAKQWRGTYDRHLAFENDPLVDASYGGTPALFAYREGGRVVQFLRGTTIVPKDASTIEHLTQVNGTTWEFMDGRGNIETYTLASSTRARLSAIRFVDGRKITLSYNGSGYLSVVADEFGHKLTFTYNAAGRITKFTDPANKAHSYTYNTAGYLTKITYPDTTFKQYTYGTGVNAGSLTGIIDESNVTYASWTYDTSKRATTSQHAGGASAITIVYNADGSRTVTDALGSVRTYQFDLIQNELKLANRLEGASDEDVSYDVNGYVASRVDRNGIETTYLHDASGLETSRTEATGTPRARTISTQWHAKLRAPTLITESNRTTAYTYNALGNVLTRTITDTVTDQSRTWTYTYDTYGRLLTVNGPRSDVSDITTYAYYTCTTGGRCGQPRTITNALGHVTTYNTYDAHGRPLTLTDPNGVVTTLVYGLRGRVTSVMRAGEAISFAYYPIGLIQRITLPDTSYIQYTYDSAHRVTVIVDGAGSRIDYALDALGNWTVESAYDPSNLLTRRRSRVYNSLNQLWKALTAAGTTAQTTEFSYDNKGQLTGIDAPMGRNVAQSFDALGRLQQITDPAFGQTQFAYDPRGNLVSVTDPKGLATTYIHSAFDELTQEVSPDTGVTQMTRDSAGNLATRLDARGKLGTYSYDSISRLTQLSYADQTLAFTYDTVTNGKGRLASVADGSGSTSWTYTSAGRALAKTQSMSGVSKTVSYGYTAGRLTSMTLPSGQVVNYTYTNGQVSSVKLGVSTTILNNVLYEPFGPVRQWSWGNGTFAVRTNDLDGKVTQIDSAGLRIYGYDDALRLTSITDTGNSSLSQTYGYDLLDRLTSATGSILNQGWTYDANGSRLSQGGSAITNYTVSSVSNRVTGVSGAISRSYTYDDNGDTLSDGTASFVYNDADRMISATKAGVTTTYSFNAMGQRIKKTRSGATTYFVYDEAGRLIGEYGSSGTLIQETVWLGGIPVATLRPNDSGVSIYYIHTDHLNTPRRISRPSDNVIVWRWDSDPFGTVAASEDPDGDATSFIYNLRFAGQYFDSETGLHYNYFRDYDPTTGGYSKSDPIGLRAGVNTYSYVRSNPTSGADPYGLDEDGAFDQPGYQVGPLFPAFTPGTRQNEELNRAGNEFLDDLNKLLAPLVLNELANELFNKAKPDREQKPPNCPTGTKPVNEDNRLDRPKIHKIKGAGGLNAEPKDWVGIDPEGNIWTNEGGVGVNNGPYESYLN